MANNSQNAGLLITKKANTPVSKFGDTVNYTITLQNTGETTLNLVSLTDPMFPDLQNNPDVPATLSPGQIVEIHVSKKVSQTEGPLTNTVAAEYSTSLNVSDTATVDLFTPSVVITKTSNRMHSKAGDVITYTYTLQNTSSGNNPNVIPNLILDSLIDDHVGDLTQAAKDLGWSNIPPTENVTLPPLIVSYTVPNNYKDPQLKSLTNTVTATFHPYGFPNVVTAEASHTVSIVHPSFTVTKDCTSGVAVPGGSATFKITITNTGDVGLDLLVEDTYNPLGPVPILGLPPFDPASPNSNIYTITYSTPVPPNTNGNCSNGLTNTVNVTAYVVQFPGEDRLPNKLTDSATATCPILIKGYTKGFWQNQNGHSILDPNGTGVPPATTLGGNGRTITIKDFATSDAILLGSYCNPKPKPGEIDPCSDLSDKLNEGTLSNLLGQTLALSYNIRFKACFGGQKLGLFGCTTLINNAHAVIPAITADTTVDQLLVIANDLIANSTSAAPPNVATTQQQAGAMNALLGDCVNVEANPI